MVSYFILQTFQHLQNIYYKMEKVKKQRKLKKLHLDLPKIQNRTSTTRISQKQNVQTSINFDLSPKMKDLRKLFFQYRSNARILQKSPYYNQSEKIRKQMVQAINTRRYDLSTEIQAEINKKYGWNEQKAQNSTLTSQTNKKNKIKIHLHYQNRIHSFEIECGTCQQLKQKITCNLAKIIYSLKNTYKRCAQIISYQTIQQNHELDFILSIPNQSTHFLDQINLRPVFAKIQLNSKDKSQITIKDFRFVKCLGNGGFSTVFLVKGNFDGKYYALKLIDKKFIIESDRDAIVQNQRYILGQLQSAFTTGLQFAFETKNHFVMVIEYCPGGELFYQLKRVKRMKQNQAKFYFLQILVGLDYIHQKNIIYRDLKPQNLLIGIDGHIKIADFGLSKPVQAKQKKSYSFCGSPEYMAPQMLMKSGHNYLLDYYCLGALLYELVIGVPPYYSLKHEEIYDSIINEQLSFPHYVQVSQELKSLLRGLLQKNSKKRLGSMFGIKQILLHPWIGKIKQKSIQNKQLEPPFLPNLQNFNFDLGDIKTDQQMISKKIQQDIMCSQFQTHFNHEFQFQNKQYQQKVEKAIEQMQKNKKQKKLLSKSKSLQSYMNFSSRQNSKINYSNMKLNQSGFKQNKQTRINFTSRQLRKVISSKGFALTIRK